MLGHDLTLKKIDSRRKIFLQVQCTNRKIRKKWDSVVDLIQSLDCFTFVVWVVIRRSMISSPRQIRNHFLYNILTIGLVASIISIGSFAYFKTAVPMHWPIYELRYLPPCSSSGVHDASLCDSDDYSTRYFETICCKLI